MNKRAAKPHGFTLVELIVVLGIVALLTAMAVPAAIRMMGNTQDDLEKTARTLKGMLDASRIYSSTFRTDTAVVYALNIRDDARDELRVGNIPKKQSVADGSGMARRLTRDEFAQFSGPPIANGKSLWELINLDSLPDYEGKINRSQADLIADFEKCLDYLEGRGFVMIPAQDAKFSSFDPGMCIPAQVSNIDWAWGPSKQLLGTDTILNEYNQMIPVSNQGLYPIYILMDLDTLRRYWVEQNAVSFQDLLIMPRRDLDDTQSPRRGLFQGVFVAGKDMGEFWPAHVFKPSGEMRCDADEKKARFSLLITTTPDERVSRGYLDAEKMDFAYDSSNAPLDDPDIPDVPVNGGRIELFKFTGRAKLQETTYAP